jgi:hypothetical protein
MTDANNQDMGYIVPIDIKQQRQEEEALNALLDIIFEIAELKTLEECNLSTQQAA